LTLADLHALAADDRRTVWEVMGDEARCRALSEDGAARLARTRRVLTRLLARRSRGSLREAVEHAWLSLGGPACVEDPTDLDDAAIFLDLLETSEAAGALEDLEELERGVARLFALPDAAASPRLQVMTIHKAKGLEFDTVIVPGLGRGTAQDERKLFLWMEMPAAGDARASLLIAPIQAAGRKADPIYEHLRMLDKEKADHECGRLLYVVSTRARRQLHLLGDVRRESDGTP